MIPDLRQTEGAAVEGEVRHGVGIDRDTGAARDGAKYDFEVLPKGTTFALRMWCDISPRDLADGYERPWLRLLALRRLQAGQIPLGGRLARGAGQVSLHDLQVYLLDLSTPDKLLAMLRTDDENARLGTLQDLDWARRQLQDAR
jgi:CRISPR/Cas system CSM-associated protein Csm3 (group 7 of RAMP superfamily)